MRDLQARALSQRLLLECGLAKAVAYLLGMCKELSLFLDDPRLPLGNSVI